MADIISSSWLGGSSYWKAGLRYYTSESATQYSITIYGLYQGRYYQDWTGAGFYARLRMGDVYEGTYNGNQIGSKWISSYECWGVGWDTNLQQLGNSSQSFYISRTFNKGTSAQSVYCESYEYITVGSGGSDTLSTTITIPALARYTVSVSAGTGGTASSSAGSIVYYGYSTTLTATASSGYHFASWSDGGAQSHSVTITSNYSATAYFAPDSPSAPTIGTNTRNSDTQNTVTWTKTGAAPYSNVLVERSTDGGDWQQVANLAGSTTSYSDTGTSANHYYKYRVRGYNSSGYSSYSSESNTTYNTPSAPTGLSGVFNTGELSVALSWNDNAVTETGYTIENAASSAFEETTTATVSANVTSYTFTGYAIDEDGNTYFRIKATGSAGDSEYSETAIVRTLTTPSAPTLTSPASGIVLDMPESITFTLVHNSRDGSALTSAVWAFSTDNETFTEVTNTAATITRTLAQLSLSRGDTLYWKAKTKGAYTGGSDNGYSEYSAVRTLTVEQSPSIVITNPVATDGGTIATVPIQVGWNYTDNSGTQASCSFNIKQGVKTLYSASYTGSTASYTVPVADLLPANNQSYTLSVTANSTSGLSVTAQRVFATDYDEPKAPDTTVFVDEENASVQIVVTSGDESASETVPTVALGLYRIDRDGEIALIDKTNITQGTIGAQISMVDYVCPLDANVEYRGVSYSATGLTSQNIATARIESNGRFFINYGEQYSNKVALEMDLAWSTSIDHNRALYQVVGLKDPVERHNNRRTKTLNASGTVWWENDDTLETLQELPEVIYVREPKGHSIPCVATIGLNYPQGTPITEANIKLTQVSYD